MVETLKRDEASPASYPAKPSGLSDAADALDAGMIWHRIESYVAHRWTARAVVWTVQGTGDWQPDLTPATVSAVERWTGAAWDAVTLDPSPLGGYRLDGATYRVTASVGGATVPPAIEGAYRRLAEYFAESAGHHGAGRYEVQIGTELRESFDRSPAWVARALQLSGAADLLRPYRRA